jgi:hydroxypyruvate isomerase
MKYSACIELLFTEFPFNERIKKAKEFGFDAIEFWEWENKDLEIIKQTCKENEIEIATFGLGQFGQMVDARDFDSIVSGAKDAVEKAKFLDCNNLILTVNILQEDRSVKPLDIKISHVEMRNNITTVLKELAKLVDGSNIVLNLEPLNSIVDHKGYFLNNSEDGFNIVKEVNHQNVKLLYDIYHLQIMEGNIIENLSNNIDRIGYIHIADVPGRHEPGTGEINYKNIFKQLENMKYQGFLGFEYEPLNLTIDSLDRVKKIFNF